MKFDMLNYCNMLKENNLNIIYSGPLWAGGIEGIAGIVKKRLEFDALPSTAARSVFSVFIEQMNNMLMYSEEPALFGEDPLQHFDVRRGAFVLGVQGKTYFVQSGNAMKTQKAGLIKERIDYLNTLGKEELRKYYREQMKKTDANEGSRGAGLGLIEIAKRASSRIEYEFTPMEDGLTFFSMYVEI